MNSVDLILYPTADMQKATKFFTTMLGTAPYAESPPYVGFKVGDFEVGLIQKTPASPGALAYVKVNDIKEALDTLIASGAEKLQDITDVGYGLLVASIKDPDGNTIGLRQFPNK